MPSLSIWSTALLSPMSSLLVQIWLPPSAFSYMRSPNSWDHETAMMESILMPWWMTSEHYSTIHNTKCTTWQYTVACRSLSSIRVVTRRIYRMNCCMEWSSVFTMIWMLYGGVYSSSQVCMGVCEVVPIVSCNETCRIYIRLIDD